MSRNVSNALSSGRRQLSLYASSTHAATSTGELGRQAVGIRTRAEADRGHRVAAMPGARGSVETSYTRRVGTGSTRRLRGSAHERRPSDRTRRHLGPWPQCIYPEGSPAQAAWTGLPDRIPWSLDPCIWPQSTRSAPRRGSGPSARIWSVESVLLRARRVDHEQVG